MRMSKMSKMSSNRDEYYKKWLDINDAISKLENERDKLEAAYVKTLKVKVGDKIAFINDWNMQEYGVVHSIGIWNAVVQWSDDGRMSHFDPCDKSTRVLKKASEQDE